jgi:predicted AlkP superfamily pyrophosphatase or phosphodiesterase
MIKRKTFLIFLLPWIVLLLFTSCSKQKAKPNILLVTIDTLRRDHLGIYGYPRQTSPFIDQLAKNGVMFRHVMTPIALTAGSHASILTSLHPLTHRCIKNGSPLPKKVQTIAEVLQKNGYYTIGTVGVNFLSKQNGFSQGFDSFSGVKGAKRSAEAVNKSLFEQIDEYQTRHPGKPFFIWVHYYDPHWPYLDREFTFKEKLPQRYDSNPPGYLKKIHCYDTEIRYTDETIKQLMDYLQRQGLTKKMVTCITADHGEQHGEHGSRGDHCDFYSENTFVPLIFHGENIPKNKIIEDFVSTMDIAETLLSTAGLTFDYKMGTVDLLRPGNYPKTDRAFLIIGNPWSVKSLQFIRPPWSYILNFDRYYRYWYISEKETGPGNLFKKIKKENISIRRQKTFSQLTIDFPHEFRKGFQYAAVRIILEEKKPVNQIRVIFNQRIKSQSIANENIKHLTIIHPVTSQDSNEIKISFSFPAETKLKSLDYAYLSPQEFNDYSPGAKKLENKIHSLLQTWRKNSTLDEIYHLKQDIEMNKNLLRGEGAQAYQDKIDDYRQSLYRWFEFYFNQGVKLIGPNKEKKKLTSKEIKILKSLGYL